MAILLQVGPARSRSFQHNPRLSSTIQLAQTTLSIHSSLDPTFDKKNKWNQFQFSGLAVRVVALGAYFIVNAILEALVISGRILRERVVIYESTRGFKPSSRVCAFFFVRELTCVVFFSFVLLHQAESSSSSSSRPNTTSTPSTPPLSSIFSPASLTPPTSSPPLNFPPTKLINNPQLLPLPDQAATPRHPPSAISRNSSSSTWTSTVPPSTLDRPSTRATRVR